jgi:hypothetical protein
MQEQFSMAKQHPVYSFGEFFAALIEAFDRQGLRLCVLRNYECFPSSNAGRDIDLLILRSELPRALLAFQSIPGIRIIGYTERRYVASFFLSGIVSESKARSLQIDFDLSLTWKGLPFLSEKAVLEAAIPRPAGNSIFYTPCPVHEAIISLLASLLVGGWLKEKYLPKVQRTFADDKLAVVAALSPNFGLKTATRFVDSVLGGDRRKVLGCVRSLRWSLVLRNCLRRPVPSIGAVFGHYASEMRFRYSPEILQTVRIAGTDGFDSETIVESLLSILQFSAVLVEARDFGPMSGSSSQLPAENSHVDLHAETSRGLFGSVASVLRWLHQEWTSQFLGNRNLTLRISQNNFCDLLIDPHRYGYRGPMWFARFADRFFPPAILWILLEPVLGKSNSRKLELSSAETLKQREGYLSFIRTRNRYVILDAGKAVESIVEDAYLAIIDALSQSTGCKLKTRF